MNRLRVAIIHYHLKRGGVTRVIESTIKGFESAECPPEIVVLAGELSEHFRYDEKAVLVDGLNYTSLQQSTPAPDILLKHLQEAASAMLGGAPDVWHIHNHSLGKNSSMPGVVSLLAKSGAQVLLHLHDFAEDGRPGNYELNQVNRAYAGELYPDCSNVHYGFINTRDRDAFLHCGLPSDRLHYLGNPIDSKELDSGQCSRESILDQLGAERLFLYPVRAVRRKNFGELVFWSTLANQGDVFATTLGPTNVDFVDQYKDWIQFVDSHNLPVQFAIGELYGWDFPSIVNASDYIVTTSIAEGFGLTFLEPYIFNRQILGRNLADITVDFTDTGLSTDHLYSSLPIPAEWLDMVVLRKVLFEKLEDSYSSYGRDLPEDALDIALEAITPMAGYVDFGGLDESLQQSVIERIAQSPELIEQLPVNSLIPSTGIPGQDINLSGFAPKSYSQRILDTYSKIMPSENLVDRYISPATILDEYLKPERFRLLRT